MTQDLRHLAGPYALDALDLPERLLFEAWLDDDAEDDTRQEVAELVATAARLADDAAETPPPALRASILDAIDGVRQEPPAVTSLDAHRARRRMPPAWAINVAAAVTLIAGVGAVSVSLLNDDDNGIPANWAAIGPDAAEVLAAPDVTIIRATNDHGGNASFVMSPSRGEGFLVAEGWAQTAEGMTYELWLMRDGVPERAGLFDVDNMGRATQTFTGDMRDVDALGVTVEPAGGSDAPTTTPILLVTLTA